MEKRIKDACWISILALLAMSFVAGKKISNQSIVMALLVSFGFCLKRG